MSIVGIVVEYNPFHNGHLYNLNKAKQITNSDTSVCIMSSNFTQRGIPSIVDKWARTEMALNCGVDLVIELPTLFSSQSAQYFSRAAVKLLDSLAVVDYICFGSELGNINPLNTTAEILFNEPEVYRRILKKYLDKGLSFPSARACALTDLTADESIKDVIREPNNILGIEYLMALKEYRSSIIPVTLKRIKAHYNSKAIEGDIASATAIRHHIGNYLKESDIQNTLPATNYSILQNCFKDGRGPVTLKSFEDAIYHRIIAGGKTYLSSIFEINEGLENKLYKAYFETNDIEELIGSVKSKRYTQTRIQRILINTLLGLSKELFETHKSVGPSYIRVLGFNKKGRQILNEARKKSTLPLISNFSDVYKYDSTFIRSLADFESISSNIYYTAYRKPYYKNDYQEHKRKVLISDK